PILTGGLKMLAKPRKVEIVTGSAKFISDHAIEVVNGKEKTTIQFENAIIAVGSQPVKLPFIPEDPRIIDSTGALELAKTTDEMLVIGGGIIGLEMATVYHALGAKITIVELMDQIIPGADADIVKPLHKIISKKYDNIFLETKVTKVEAKKDGIYVTFEGKQAPDKPQKFDQVLVAVGRIPNGKLIDAEKAGVNVNERGFIPTDNQMRTNVSHIYAIGDVVGNPMLAHKAIPEARIAAEAIAGMKHFFEPKCIASVAYTDPEVAWVGVTENEAKKQGIEYGKGAFPWAASGRSLSMGRDEGMTKVIFDAKTNRIIGAGIVGPHAGDLIAEAALAIEMGCDAEDIALTIHPHPTLSETIAMATEVFEGTITDLYIPKK
ncbi:MAG: NAD(P)/FAD-dependent oxidoreductase, partial [Gammaproteobacteria bacterium]